MIRKLKIKFVLIIMLLLTIVLTTLLAALFMYQKNQIYVNSVNAMKEAMAIQTTDVHSSLLIELFGLYSRSSRYPYFNTFVLEVDQVNNTITAIGYEEELDDEKKEYLLSLVRSVPAVNNAEGILPTQNLRYYVNTTSRGMKIAFLDKEYEDASLRDMLKNSLWIISLSLLGFLVISLIMTKIATAPVEKSWKQQKQLVADMSHELKTPLQSIIGSAELLENGLVKPEDQPRFLNRIHQEADRLVALINDILRLSQLDEGGALPHEQVSVLELAQEAARSLTAQAAAQAVHISVTGTAGTVFGVRRLLYEIARNLCENAVKYNVPGGSVTVEVAETDRDVTLLVRDTGIGIPEGDQSRVFERFYRVDKSHSRAIGGTGLGLSIVKHAVAYHHGTLRLESQPGKGTVITVTLPKEPTE